MNTVDLAYNTLKQRLADGAWAAGTRLPSLNRLAQLCGVSRSTMWKSLTLLKKESAIHTNPRGSIFAGPPGTSRIDPVPAGLLWERLQTRMGQDIITGVFGSQELPSVTKLALRYKVTIRTIKKALMALSAQGVLETHGRRFIPIRGRMRRRTSSLMFISYGTTSGGISLGDPRIQQVVECFERECARLGFISLVEGFNEQDPRSFMELSTAIKKIPDISGFIVNLWFAWNETHLRRWYDLLLFLAGRNVPVVILDQSGMLTVPSDVQNTGNVKILRIASEKAGESAAEVMLRAGHTTIAYVTPYFNTHWARSRYTGIDRYVKNYGPPGATVELHALGEMADQNDLNLAIMELGKEEVQSLYHDHYTQQQIQELTDRLEQKHWLELKRKTALSDDTGIIRNTARFLVGVARAPHNRYEYNYLLEALHHIASNRAIEDYLKPILLEILAKTRATAWVCSDDKTAITAVTVLRKHGRKVPADISVMGFDNWRSAYENQLSTYDFNMNGLVQQAILMTVDEKTFRSKGAISEVDGYMVERRTTRR